jgi:uncharacterized protein YodC (DUF2158 family)
MKALLKHYFTFVNNNPKPFCMINQFKPGDLVKLKTGRQPMTIKGVATKPSSLGIVLINDQYECSWHDGLQQQKAIFHSDELEWFVPRYDMLQLKNCWSL